MFGLECIFGIGCNNFGCMDNSNINVFQFHSKFVFNFNSNIISLTCHVSFCLGYCLSKHIGTTIL